MNLLRFQRSAFALVLSAATIAGVVSVHPGSARAAEADQPFKVGLMVPLSGPGAGGAAEGAQQGLALALAEINAAGIAARRFETIVVDDASDPRTAVDVCNRLILQEKVSAIISQGPTPTRMACNQAALRAGIPHIAAVSGPGGICIPNMVMVGPETSQTLLTLIQQVVKDGHKKLFYIGSDYSALREALTQARQTAEQLGGSIVDSTFVPFGSTDFAAELGKISAARPDVVIMMLVGADAVTFARQFGEDARMAGIQRADFLMTEKALRSLGSAARDTYVAANYYAAIDGEANKVFKSSMSKMFGAKAIPDTWAMMTYNAMYLLAGTVKTPASGPKEVLSALPGAAVDGPQGRIQVVGNYVSTPVYVARTTADGDLKVIAHYDNVAPAGCRK